MAPHFTYEPVLSKAELMQGDVLERTPDIDGLLSEIHPHFFKRKNNLFFIVLTQSCDLVQRSASGGCKAPYITIAPVRPLESVIERHLQQLAAPAVMAELPVLSSKAKSKASEFLVRVFNNNEPGYFYLDSEETALPCDCVAFLNLSIAIKANEHLQKCLAAKILQLTDVFQAKLGWLVGQMYSRVGTDDFPHEVATQKTKLALKDAALWVEDGKVSALEMAYASLQQAQPGVPMTVEQVKEAISRAKTKKQEVLERTAVVIDKALGDSHGELAQKLRKRLESDAALSQLLR